MQILYTGFKGENNSSYQLLQLIDGNKLFLTNSFEGVLYHTKLDAASVKELLNLEGVACELSFTPTRYLCNAAYWHMLRKNHGKAIFIHIPTNKNMAEEMRGKLAKCLRAMHDNIIYFRTGEMD